MDALVIFILTAGAVITAFCVGQWLGAKAIMAHGKAQVARMLRNPEEAREQAEYLAAHADELESRKGKS